VFNGVSAGILVSTDSSFAWDLAPPALPPSFKPERAVFNSEKSSFLSSSSASAVLPSSTLIQKNTLDPRLLGGKITFFHQPMVLVHVRGWGRILRRGLYHQGNQASFQGRSITLMCEKSLFRYHFEEFLFVFGAENFDFISSFFINPRLDNSPNACEQHGGINDEHSSNWFKNRVGLSILLSEDFRIVVLTDLGSELNEVVDLRRHHAHGSSLQIKNGASLCNRLSSSLGARWENVV